MTEPRILIAGSAYIDNEGLRELCKLWSRVVTYLDPHADVVIIDSASPFEPKNFLSWQDSSEFPPIKGPMHCVYRFDDNIGHLSRGGEDGAGRTYCKAFELAIDGLYDYLAFIETDIIFMRPVAEIIGRMARNGIKAAAVPNFQYQFPEFGVSFFDVKWAKEFDFVGKYNWKSSQPWPIPEVRLMNLLKDYLALFPLYGIRIDQTGITPESLSNAFPYFPPAWVTHASDLNLYTRAIMLNGIQLP